MKKVYFTLLVLLFALTSCSYVAPVVPPSGLLFSNIKAPLDVDVNQTKVYDKQGEASSSNVLGLFSFGDCSINTAARNGNIKTIEHADYEHFNILGLYQNFKVVVYGE